MKLVVQVDVQKPFQSWSEASESIDVGAEGTLAVHFLIGREGL